MALTYTYSDIAASQTDADSPLDQTLMDSIREDLYHLRQVLYGNGSGGFHTPADGHDHDGSNSEQIATITDGIITPAKLSDMSAGNYYIAENDSEITNGNGNYTKEKEFKTGLGGTIRFYFEIKSSFQGTTVYARVYRNGTPVGTEQSTIEDTYQPKSVDISGWSAGDLIQLRIKGFASATCYVRNFRVGVAAPHIMGRLKDY
jgi:hypothetical protein